MTDPDSRAEPDDALILRLVREHFSADFRHQLLCQRQVGDTNEDAPTFAIQQFALGIWQAARRTLPQGYAAGIEAAAKVCEGTEPPYLLGERPVAASPEAQEIADQMYKYLGSVRETLAAAVRSLAPSPDAGVVEK